VTRRKASIDEDIYHVPDGFIGSIDHTRQSGESADEISGRVPMANEESADPK
jgi:hypothetical protein